MARQGLRNCDDSYEARRGKRQRTKCSGEALESKLRNYASLVQKVSSSEDADEDYVELLKLNYYVKISDSYTNEHGNGGSSDEVEDEDEADPHNKMFLANAKRDGTSSDVLNVDTKEDIEMQEDAVDEEKMMGKGSKTVHVRGKEKASDVDEDSVRILKNLQCENLGMKASLRSDCNIEREATEDDLEIPHDSTDVLKK